MPNSGRGGEGACPLSMAAEQAPACLPQALPARDSLSVFCGRGVPPPQCGPCRRGQAGLTIKTEPLLVGPLT